MRIFNLQPDLHQQLTVPPRIHPTDSSVTIEMFEAYIGEDKVAEAVTNDHESISQSSSDASNAPLLSVITTDV